MGGRCDVHGFGDPAKGRPNYPSTGPAKGERCPVKGRGKGSGWKDPSHAWETVLSHLGRYGGTLPGWLQRGIRDRGI